MFKKLLHKWQSAAVIGEGLHPGLLEKCYREKVEDKQIDYDPAQIEALKALQKLLEKLLIDNAQRQKTGFNKSRAALLRQSRNLYLFGGVGFGKSMLMDLFYENCPIEKKRRVHFHTFMLEVHEFSHHWRKTGNGDVILALAEAINKQASLLCFDEFHVIDVANAVILDRLFRRLYELGTVIVSTSNRHPDDLYQGGITPELFQAFIERLKEVSDIVELTAEKDYRLIHVKIANTVYNTPITPETRAIMENRYRELAHCVQLKPCVVTVLGREITLAAAHGDVALSSFKALCEAPLGPADYLKLTGLFKTLILTDIPRLRADNHDEAKRFSTLIDALYFHNVVLICSAEAPPKELFDSEINAFFLKRTVSRLIEMQSEQYLNRTR
ncbi:MAG: cell division protein ZapE [Gammaproteobacteria bacterium HGW-Gammaproteobacteria-3]|nr:MAG: cell division protein ZapE [Gammaproteobacteria bacterium HGW-Gammaproteobacteria-3]